MYRTMSFSDSRGHFQKPQSNPCSVCKTRSYLTVWPQFHGLINRDIFLNKITTELSILHLVKLTHFSRGNISLLPLLIATKGTFKYLVCPFFSTQSFFVHATFKQSATVLLGGVCTDIRGSLGFKGLINKHWDFNAQ
jgi:hypothetical protein